MISVILPAYQAEPLIDTTPRYESHVEAHAEPKIFGEPAVVQNSDSAAFELREPTCSAIRWA